MAFLGNNKAAYEERRYLKESEVEISERAFNGIIGGVLLWGFLLNYIIVHFFGYQAQMLMAGSPIAFLIGYIILVVIGSVLIAKPSPGLSFLGYNLIALPIGVVVCGAVSGIDPAVVKSAVMTTAFVTLSMMILATLFPGFFLGMGRVLISALGICLLGYFISSLFFGRSMIYEWIFTAIFSLYIGFDWARANTCARTVDNAVDLAAMLYVDIINLFLRILEIISKKKD